MNEIIFVKCIAGKNEFFNYPSGIRFHQKSNLLYIADMYNHRICWLKDDGSVGSITNVIVGDNQCAFLGRPLAVWSTEQGMLFAADAQYNKIFYNGGNEEAWRPIKISPEVSFNFPGGVAVDEEGNIYTNDFLNNRLVQITFEGQMKILLEGEKNLIKPYGIFYQNRRLYYTDTGNARVGYIDLNNGHVNLISPHIEGKALYEPVALTLDEEGNIYICERRSMYFLDMGKNTLSLIVDENIWKSKMEKYQIKDRICHMGSVTVKNKGEIYWADTIKGGIYQMIFNLS